MASERAGIVIGPEGEGGSLRLREIWEFRELLFFLSWRDIKVRYRQTVLGVLWAVVQPVTQMLLFSVFFGRLGGMPTDGTPYPLLAYAALVPWNFFASAVTQAGNSLATNAQLLTKVYFPRAMLPGAAVLTALVDLGASTLALVPLLVYYGVAPTWRLVLLPPLIAVTALLAFGVGAWMAVLSTRFRDLRHVFPFVVQIWLFATPVIYPAEIVPERLRWLLVANPVTGIVEGFRFALLARPVEPLHLCGSALAALLLGFTALRAISRLEQQLADVI